MAATPATQGGGKAAVRKQQVTFKLVFDSPFQLRWPALDEAGSQALHTALQGALAAVRGETPQDSLRRAKAEGLLVGVNAVTRGLEAGTVDAVLVCRSSTAAGLLQHLPAQAQQAGVALCALAGLSDMLAAAWPVHSAVAVAVAKVHGPGLQELAHAVQQHGKVARAQWLQPGPGQAPAIGYLALRLKRLQLRPKPAP